MSFITFGVAEWQLLEIVSKELFGLKKRIVKKRLCIDRNDKLMIA